MTDNTALLPSDEGGVKHTPPAHLALYMSNWKPHGVRSDWDKCSMDLKSTERLIGDWARNGGKLVEAVAWFDFEGDLRVLVADYDSGRRLVLRHGRGGWKITYQRHDRAALAKAEPR